MRLHLRLKPGRTPIRFGLATALGTVIRKRRVSDIGWMLLMMMMMMVLATTKGEKQGHKPGLDLT
jgi:hypothetical protein